MLSRLARLATAGATIALGSVGAVCMPLSDWAVQVPPCRKAAEVVAKYEESADWVRADLTLANGGDGHAIFDTLGAKTNAIPMYRIYARRDGSAVAAIATASQGCDGHKGIVHGGVTAMLFDNTLGWTNAVSILAENGALMTVLAGVSDESDSTSRFGFTANLLVNYKAPFKQGATVEILCRLDRVEGRKRFLVGVMKNIETEEELADCTSLFVIPRECSESN